MAQENLIEQLTRFGSTASQAWLQPWQAMTGRFGDADWQREEIRIELRDFDRLAEDTLRIQQEWLRTLRGMIDPRLPMAPLASLWLSAAETALEAQGRAWTEWLRQTAQVQLSWRQYLPGESPSQTDTRRPPSQRLIR